MIFTTKVILIGICIAFFNVKCIFYADYIFWNNTTGNTKHNLNSCDKKRYEILATALIQFLPAYENLKSQETTEEVSSFFKSNKRKLFDRRSTQRPIYTIEMNGNEIVKDKYGVPVVLVHRYDRDHSLMCTKVLLYKEVLQEVLEQLHHLPVKKGSFTCLPGGINGLSKLFSSTYQFNGSFEIIKAFLANCENCQLNTPLPSTCKPPLIPIRTYKPHYRLQCDLIDMAPKKYREFMCKNKWGYRYILTIKCCFSKFCWLFPLKYKTAVEVYHILRLLFIKEGAPKILQSDNGGEFIADIIKKLSKDFKVNLVHGRPHHPQSQGQVENLNKQVKRCLARFLQHVKREEQPNLWPVLLSGIADFQNSKWHSTINDIPFRVYRNREPSGLTSHVVPDDDFFLSSLDEPCLADYEFGEEDMMESLVGQSSLEGVLQTSIKTMVSMNPDDILASSFGTLSEATVNLLQKVGTDNTASVTTVIDTNETGDIFEVHNFNKFLGHISLDFKVLTLNVLESTEYTIQKNVERSGSEHSFKVGDKVVYKVDHKGKNALQKKEPFDCLNEIGVIEEVLPGGMYKVSVAGKDECSTFVKCLYSSQMTKIPSKGCTQTDTRSNIQMSFLSLHNSISEYATTVRKEMYNCKLRRCTKKRKCSSSIDTMFKRYDNALDFGFLAMISSLSNKDKTSYYHGMFIKEVEALKKDGFKYFLYGTIHWENERKQKFSSKLLDHISEMHDHTDCFRCLQSDLDKPCLHPCCQEKALQLALNSGLITKDDAGVLSLCLSTTHKTGDKVTSAPLSESPKTGTTASPVINQPPSSVTVCDKNSASSMPSRMVAAVSEASPHSLINMAPSPIIVSHFDPISDGSFEALKLRCLSKVLDNADFSEFKESLHVLLSDCLQDSSTLSNLQYLDTVVGKHGTQHGELHVKSSSEIWMQSQGFSSFCGLCAMNNSLCLESGDLPIFTVEDLDLAADVMWLKQLILCGKFSMSIEPMRFLDGDYSIVALEKATLSKGMSFQRLDAEVRSLTDGVDIKGLSTSCFTELYNLFLQLFFKCDAPSLVVRIKEHHYISLVFKTENVILLDSKSTAPQFLSPKDGMVYLQQECQDNSSFSAFNIGFYGSKLDPIDVDVELLTVHVKKDFTSTLEDIWQKNSSLGEDTIVSEKHGCITVRDLRSLQPGALVNDAVMNYIGNFLMSQNKGVFVADTFWLQEIQKKKRTLMTIDLSKYNKLIFPVHSPGHWWCVMIDTTTQVYGEYDSLYRDRDSSYVFGLLSSVCIQSKIDLSTFRRLNKQERMMLPSQGHNTKDCGVYVLCSITLFLKGIISLLKCMSNI